jgi:hypothetical protein
MVKKSADNISSQCCFRNSFHLVSRYAPMLVRSHCASGWRQPRLSPDLPEVRQRTDDSPIAPVPFFDGHLDHHGFDFGLRGPGPPLPLPSYFRAIRFRRQASRVFGVTMVARR